MQHRPAHPASLPAPLSRTVAPYASRPPHYQRQAVSGPAAPEIFILVTNYLDTDLRDTEAVLTGAAALLDFREPIAVLMVGVLQLIPDRDGPHAIVARLMEAVPSGSWLAVFHPASDILADEIGEAARRVNVRSANMVTLRSRGEVEQFFDGLELLDPGLVQVHRWRPDTAAPDIDDQVAGYAGLARKP